jgi:hypothetical protein
MAPLVGIEFLWLVFEGATASAMAELRPFSYIYAAIPITPIPRLALNPRYFQSLAYRRQVVHQHCLSF